METPPIVAPNERAALDAALAQINATFGAGPDTPERRRRMAEARLERLFPALEGARKAADADQARHPNECPDIAIDAFSAYVVAWFLRREADADEAIAKDGVSEALEEVADAIESGRVFGVAGEMLADLVAEIHHAAYVVEHGEEPPTPMPPLYRADDVDDGLPF